ncbi:MAG: hypothetical protein M3285_07660 [Actinomycetota bacterium]|nr:hypothetical protein [Actinomycetota bacterium]
MRKTRLVTALVLSGLLATAFAPSSSAGPVMLSASPEDQVLVISANLRERTKKDMEIWDDMAVFVRRVVQTVPYAPDVLLLQEVRQQSAQSVALLLGTATDQTYELAVKRGNRYSRRLADGTAVVNETAILINTQTVARIGKGGHETFTYTPEEARPDSLIKWKKGTHAMVGEIGGDFALSLASVHFQKDAALVSPEMALAKKLSWTTQMDDRLVLRYAATDQRVIGGDFNQNRCLDGGPGCTPNPFWQAMNERGYRDSVLAMVGKGNPIDFIFSRAPVIDADFDSEYDPEAAEGTTEFYSDHRFRWALLEQIDTTAPIEPTNLRSDAWRRLIRMVWTQARDGGTGITHYEVFRSTQGNDFVSIGTTTDHRFSDSDVITGETYDYYVVAYDGAGLSATSETITETASPSE